MRVSLLTRELWPQGNGVLFLSTQIGPKWQWRLECQCFLRFWVRAFLGARVDGVLLPARAGMTSYKASGVQDAIALAPAAVLRQAMRRS